MSVEPRGTSVKSRARASGRTSLAARAEKWWRRCGSKEHGFWYVQADGTKITDRESLERVRSLVIPPAWSDVRIAPSAKQNVQVLGVDTSGRTQYLYHPSFTARQEARKFKKLSHFAKYLPQLRKATRSHLSGDTLTRTRVLALIVRLMSSLFFRVGSEKSVERYKTFGATTLRKKHILISRSASGEPRAVTFDFVGKHHVQHEITLKDKTLARMLAELVALPGTKIFRYYDDDGSLRDISARDVNNYIKSVTHRAFSAKDFRTWGGTLLAAKELAVEGLAEGAREVKKKIVSAVRRVAEKLGNTPAVARGSYIHPLVLKAYESGHTLAEYAKGLRYKQSHSSLTREERALLRMLAGK